MSTIQTRKASGSSASEKAANSDPEKASELTSEQKLEDLRLKRRLDHSKALAIELDRSVGARRTAALVRKSFVRNDDPEIKPPLQQLVAKAGGRGATVPVLLYIALLWKCAAKPYDVQLPARKWAELLALPDPSTKGARRITNALEVLANLKLVKLEKSHGEPTRVILRDESGEDRKYENPSTAYSLKSNNRDLYFKVSSRLWTSGQIQQLKAPELSMLLILLQEGGHRRDTDPLANFLQRRGELLGVEVWFTTENFPARYGISPSMRSRGTKGLCEAGLLETERRPVGPPGKPVSFSTEKLRKIYRLQGDAVIAEASIKDQKKTKK
ncbi:hypothetical protein AOZ07_01560 [Glutamicibacter halophytocola]|uniref:hypothetical protein n=1 Tax=Glutamicibacter halophytocola TaxID=1933880 RepID=UPI0006D4AE4B|nr:hypothetical protein [Glutamicibacter halophytocola]ALG27814.1 hypothetical protein AOZ07_01560 [Glutamicibacter halophytocola]